MGLLFFGALLSCVGVKLARFGLRRDSRRGWAIVGGLLSMAGVILYAYRAYLQEGWPALGGFVALFVFIVFIVKKQN